MLRRRDQPYPSEESETETEEVSSIDDAQVLDPCGEGALTSGPSVPK